MTRSTNLPSSNPPRTSASRRPWRSARDASIT
jgi:hypothetical protein